MLKTMEAKTSKAFIIALIAASVLSLILLVATIFINTENNIHSFEETAISLETGWTITDSSGNKSNLEFPKTIKYGKDGIYTLETVISKNDDIISSPSLCIYSNYVDLDVYINGESVYSYPFSKSAFSGGTGNTWHYIRLNEYKDCNLKIVIHGQLGNRITYLLEAPQIGSKATMFNIAVQKSFSAFIITSCMLVLSITLLIMYITLKRRLSLDYSALCISMFAFSFGIYVYFESAYAKLLNPNGYSVYSITLMMLSLLPIPLMMLFRGEVVDKLKKYANIALCISFANFVIQTALHYLRISNYRIMLPITHITMVASIVIMLIVMIISSKCKYKNAETKLISAIPMIIGGFTDIILLSIGKPSFNNSLYFVIGVTVFIVFQFIGVLGTYFNTYRTALESDYYRNIAYLDLLSNLENRNSYELELERISETMSCDGVGCIVVDINKLKRINDTLGHQAGDHAIAETANIIKKSVPAEAKCYRTGGDEFTIIIEASTSEIVAAAADKIVVAADKIGGELRNMLSVSAGSGIFMPEDDDINGLIKRVDDAMYKMKYSMNGQK